MHLVQRFSKARKLLLIIVDLALSASHFPCR